MSNSVSASSKLASAAIAFFLGLGYAAIIAVLAALMTGAGHGWGSAMISAIGIVLIPLASVARLYQQTQFGRMFVIITAVAAIVTDVWLIVATSSEGFSYVEKVYSAMPLILFVWLILWLAWQIAILGICLLPKSKHP